MRRLRKPFDLFPGYLLAENRRHPKNVLVCPGCGDLNEVEDRKSPGDCIGCGTALRQADPHAGGVATARIAGIRTSIPGKPDNPWRTACSPSSTTTRDGEPSTGAVSSRSPTRKTLRGWRRGRAMGAGQSPPCARGRHSAGDETGRLHRWGVCPLPDMFNPRQLLGLELSCRLIAEIEDKRIRHALATNLSDLLRYQNMLCRYDTMALKSLDIFSVHGFPVGLVQCESNLLGIVNGAGANVGSGGWSNIIDKYVKAKRYCEAPFEVRRHGSRNVRVPVEGEWIGEKLNGRRRAVAISCASATGSRLPPRSLDAVFTDPPYFGNVQYGELMDFCYVWLRRLAGNATEGFSRASTRSRDELTGNVTQDRGLTHFTEGLSSVYSRMAEALKPGAPLVFTYHHNKLDAYCAVGVAILDAGLVCSASLPCPAEMGGSIHIHGTASSIMDTVFVCRSSGQTPGRWLFDTPERLVEIAGDDLAHLASTGRTPTPWRYAVHRLRSPDSNGGLETPRPLEPRFACFREARGLREAVSTCGDPEQLARWVMATEPDAAFPGLFYVSKQSEEGERGDVSF